MPKGNREVSAYLRYTAKRWYIQCWHKPLHCINTRFCAASTQKSSGRATSEIETQEEKAAAALGDWNHFNPSGISSLRLKLFLSLVSFIFFPLFSDMKPQRFRSLCGSTWNNSSIIFRLSLCNRRLLIVKMSHLFHQYYLKKNTCLRLSRSFFRD